MPYISAEVPTVNEAQKKELIEQLTATVSRITHIPQQGITVVVKEIPTDNIGVGGVPLTEVLKNFKH